MSEGQIVSIYALINPIDDSVFYIGCTHTPWERLSQHITESKNSDSYKSKIIQEIKQTGHDVEMLVLDKCHISAASFWEEFYMQLYKSYGFTLKQVLISTYTDSHKNRKFLYGASTTLNISKDVTNYIKELAKDLGLVGSDFLLKCAIKEFIDRCKLKLDIPNKSKIELLHSLMNDLRKEHPYFN